MCANVNQVESCVGECVCEPVHSWIADTCKPVYVGVFVCVEGVQFAYEPVYMCG